MPSSFPLCPSSGVIGHSYIVPLNQDCIKIDFFPGGTISRDIGNSGCMSPTEFANKLSNYDSFAGSVATFNGFISGNITIKVNLNLSEVKPEELSFSGGMFEHNLMFPTCPSAHPSLVPSHKPSSIPSVKPSYIPSLIPSNTPSGIPLLIPSALPTIEPSVTPSIVPTSDPSIMPSNEPNNEPSVIFFTKYTSKCDTKCSSK